MAETFVLEGSPRHGRWQHGVYAAIILVLPLVIISKEPLGGGTFTAADAAFAVFFAGFGIAFLAAAIRGFGRRRLEVDDQGVRLFVRGGLDWSVPWEEVSEIGTHAVSFRYAMVGSTSWPAGSGGGFATRSRSLRGAS